MSALKWFVQRTLGGGDPTGLGGDLQFSLQPLGSIGTLGSEALRGPWRWKASKHLQVERQPVLRVCVCLCICVCLSTEGFAF